jgi:response regulator RpfG family c-di-GMP phosphodiesterase
MDIPTQPVPGAPLSASARPVVVFVDDEPAILRAYGRLLRDEPYDMMTFEDPARALGWIERFAVDLVVSDERMPVMKGTEFLEEVVRRSPRTKCALITAYPEPRVVARESVARIERLIAKPWNEQDLKATIRYLLGHRGRRDRDRWIRDDLLRCDPEEGPTLEVRIDVAGRTRAHVMHQVLPLCLWSHESMQRPVLVLENLAQFADPLQTLLGDLICVVERLEARLSVRDGTGAVAAALAVLRKAGSARAAV